LRTTNPHNVIKATFEGLTRLKNENEMRARRGAAGTHDAPAEADA
jgi:ribosomal protein S5